MKHKNVLVLGASGATGQRVVQMALDRGHTVTALVRSKEGIEERDGLNLIQGDVSNTATIEGAVDGKALPGQVIAGTEPILFCDFSFA